MRRILALITVTALMLALTAMPALAQPLFTGGLVNVNVSGNTIQLPIGVAANVCGVKANVLAQQLTQTGSATCTAQNPQL